MLSYAMQDVPSSAQYIQLYANSGDKIDRVLTELQPMLSNRPEQEAFSEIQECRRTWAPRFHKLLQLCQGGQIKEAYKLRNENKQLSAKMHGAATNLATAQEKVLDAVAAESDASASRSDWFLSARRSRSGLRSWYSFAGRFCNCGIRWLN